MTYYICILDLEATCWVDKRNDKIREIIEFPSVLYKVDQKCNMTLIAEFQKYVKPTLNPVLSDFCIELTKITQDTVNNADVFEIVYKQHYEWIKQYVLANEKLIFITCGKWDLATMLPTEVKRNGLELYDCYTKFVDLKDEFSKKFGVSCSGMINMLTKLKIEQGGQHHSGINDCKNLAKVVIKMIENKHIFLIF